MADPKYENLPGIAYDQPDVYECGDLPEADQPEPRDDEDNECIEQTNLSVKESFGKFKGKFVDDNVDFSDRLGKKSRTGYRVGEWSLAAAGEPETIEERYQRLRCEFAELVEQVATRESTANDVEKEEITALAAQINSTKRVLDELKIDEGETIDPKAAQIEKLLLTAGLSTGGGKTSASLRIKPDVSLAQSTRVAQLEQRLHRLEAAAGVRDEQVFRRLQMATGEPTLCSAAATLATRAALLRPAEMAAAEARVGALLSNMDAVKEAVSPANPERDAKVNELYDMLKKVEGVSHTEILERMQALESLHNQASNFGKSLSELEILHESIASGVQNNKELLQGVQGVFAHNIESIQKEIKKLEERVDRLVKA